MRTLHNHIIIYDDECPMCDLYTRGFVKFQLLEREGRESYSKMRQNHPALFDTDRACNEIALIDMQTGAVSYGIGSLIKVLGSRFPIVQWLFQFSLIRWFLEKWYGLISYNRKVIMPVRGYSSQSCTPSFHRGYRLTFLLMTWAITALALFYYARLFQNWFPPAPFYREVLIGGGQLFMQGALLYFLKKDHRVFDYLGNLMTVSVGGALFLIVALVIFHWWTPSPEVAIAYFMCVAGLMLVEHIRRVKLLALPGILSVTWILYRIIVLLIVL